MYYVIKIILMVEASVIITTLVLSGLSVFQMLLITGAPWGNFVWGGGYKVLPINLRISSFIAILLYLVFEVIILEKTNYYSVLPSKTLSNFGIWIITIYFFIGTVMNALSLSKYEKLTMTPISFVLACLCLFIALK